MSVIEGALMVVAAVVLFAFVHRLVRAKGASAFVKSDAFGDGAAIIVSAGIASGLVLSALHAESDGLVMDAIAVAIMLGSLGWLVWRLKRAA